MERGATIVLFALLTGACDVDVRTGPSSGPPSTPPTRPDPAPEEGAIPFTVEWPLDQSDLLGADRVRVRGRTEREVSITIEGQLAETEGERWWAEVPLPPGQDLSLRVSGLRDHRFRHRELRLHNTLPIGPFRGAAPLGQELLLLQDEHLLRVDPAQGIATRIVPRRAATNHPLDELMVDLAASQDQLYVLTEDALYAGVEGPERLRRLFRFPAEQKGRRVLAAPGGQRLGLVLGEEAVFEHEVETGVVRLHLPPPRAVMALTDAATWFADGEQLYRAEFGGGAPKAWMPLRLQDRPQRLLNAGGEELALVDGGDLVLVDTAARRSRRVGLEFLPRTGGIFLDGRLWASARVGSGPDELMAFNPETGVAETRIGASLGPSHGLFGGFAHDLRPRAGLGALLHGDVLLFPRADREAMLRWDLNAARLSSAVLPGPGPFLPFSDEREIVLAGGEKAWLWREDGSSLPRASFGDACEPLRRAVAVRGHWVGLCGDGEIIIRAHSALEAERYRFDRPIHGLAAGEGTRVWLADDDQIFEWDVDRFITLRLRPLPPDAPAPTALASDGDQLYAGLDGGIVRYDEQGRAGMISLPAPFDSRPVDLFVDPERALLILVDAAQRGVFAVDQRTGARALLLR